MNTANDDGWTPLNTAANGGHIEIAQALVVARADMNKATQRGPTLSPSIVAR